MMTHDGPQDSGTCNARTYIPKDLDKNSEVPGFYRFGSVALANLLKEKRDHCILNVHGHDHYGAFMDYVR